MGGLGLLAYVEDWFNVFDMILVLASWIELFLPESNSSGFLVLRTFRLLRVLKLFK